MMSGRRAGVLGALAGVALLAAAPDARAQQAEDGRWLPWLGCWIEVEAPPDSPMTCVTPVEGGVELRTVTDAGIAEQETLRADGLERALAREGCEGVEAVEFSADGTRLYTRSRLSCEGGAERTSRGLIAMVDADQWIRVRALEVGERSVSWVKRYRPAPSQRVEAAGVLEAGAVDGRRMAVEAARMAAAAPVTVDDLIEAHARTDPEAVRAWIAEQGEPLPLDAEGLIRLADAGVPEAVIDVAIAVSFPERFALARQPSSDRDMERWGRYGSRGRMGVWPYSYDPFYYPYSYGYRGWSPYWSWGGYGYGGYGYGGTIVVVRQTDRGGNGRAVKGRGYTRGLVGTAGSGASLRSRPAASSTTAAPSRVTRDSRPSSSSSKGKAKAKPKGGG